MRELTQRSLDPRACRENAERFSCSVFDAAIDHQVQDLLRS
jgi:hypothetical protein